MLRKDRRLTAARRRRRQRATRRLSQPYRRVGDHSLSGHDLSLGNRKPFEARKRALMCYRFRKDYSKLRDELSINRVLSSENAAVLNHRLVVDVHIESILCARALKRCREW